MKFLYNRINAITTLVIMMLLVLHMNVNASEVEKKATAELVYAVFDREYDKIEELLKNGANPNPYIKSSYDEGSLILPVIWDSTHSSMITEKILKLLLAHKATVDYYMDGKEPFVMAAANPAVFELLSNHTKTIPFPTNILCRFVDSNARIGLQEGIASAALVMERPEFNNGIFIEAAYKHIEEEHQKALKHFGLFGYKEYVARAVNILDGARIKIYQQRVAEFASKVLEVNSPDAPQILLPPLAEIIAQYGAEYYCMDTLPLRLESAKQVRNIYE